MKKLMKKKVNIFGKGIPVFALVLVGMMAFASAALLPYFGQITGLVTVTEAVTVGDTIDWTASVIAGSSIDSNKDYTITNNAEDAIKFALTTTCAYTNESVQEEDCLGTELVTTYVKNDGAVLTLDDLTLATGESITFKVRNTYVLMASPGTYTITTNVDGTIVPDTE